MTQQTLETTDSRQELLAGWDQEKLRNARVVINGLGNLGQLVAGCLAGMRCGSILMMDDARSKERGAPFFPQGLPGARIGGKVAQTLELLSEETMVSHAPLTFRPEYLNAIEYSPTHIIDTQNDSLTKLRALGYARERGIPFISAQSDETSVVIAPANTDQYNPRYEGISLSEQGIIPAAIGAGIIADEVRKTLFTFSSIDKPLEREVHYALEDGEYLAGKSKTHASLWDTYPERVLVGGAGAIGNTVALCLALSGFQHIDIIDNDVIEQSNLERQLLFYGSVGRSKAEILAKRIGEIAPVVATPLDQLLEEKSATLFEQHAYLAAFGCFDNNEARYILNEHCKTYSITYIDGGTGPSEGFAASYLPGKTACMGCQKLLKRSTKRDSCPAAPTPSVVIPNMVTGGLMVGEYMRLHRGYLPQNIGFASNEEPRIGLRGEVSKRKGCAC